MEITWYQIWIIWSMSYGAIFSFSSSSVVYLSCTDLLKTNKSIIWATRWFEIRFCWQFLALWWYDDHPEPVCQVFPCETHWLLSHDFLFVSYCLPILKLTGPTTHSTHFAQRHERPPLLTLRTGRWLYDGIMWLALPSIKSNNVDFLYQIY